MAKHLTMGTYTSAAWVAQIGESRNRIDVVKPLFEKLGGSIESAYLAFGSTDLVCNVELSDTVSAAAVGMAFAAGGAIDHLQTTPLNSIEDGVAAMKKASEISYTPPGR